MSDVFRLAASQFSKFVGCDIVEARYADLITDTYTVADTRTEEDVIAQISEKLAALSNTQEEGE